MGLDVSGARPAVFVCAAWQPLRIDNMQKDEKAGGIDRARRVQLGMLPQAPKVEGLEIAVHYESCDAVGGDFYDFIYLSPTELGIVVADVSGHGVDAALLMVAAKKTIQIHARNNSSPAEVLKVACEDLAPEMPKQSFVTVWYGVLNKTTGLLRYASAGHNPVILLRDGEVSTHSAKGVVLGAAFARSIRNILEEESIQLTPGDSFLLYTDGVSEAANGDGEQFGTGRLIESVQGCNGLETQKALGTLLERVDGFRDGTAPDDDVTMLWFRFSGESATDEGWKPRAPMNLPPIVDRFVGRESELKNLESAVASRNGAVSVVGMAGLGKTRIALEAAWRVASRYSGGAWLVSLRDCRDRDSIVAAIAGAIGAQQLQGNLVDSLAKALNARGPMLLILDNAETVRDSLRGFLDSILPKVDRLFCMITSQLTVGVEGETEIRLSPLKVPGLGRSTTVTPESAMKHAAVELFVDRARRAEPDFELTDTNLAPVLEICTEVEGVPLAIELLAAQMQRLTPAQLLRELKSAAEQDLPALGDSTNINESLQEVVLWSYSRLEPWQQDVLKQLCTLSGWISVDAAEALIDMPQSVSDVMVYEAIESLLRSNFVWAEHTPFGDRFRVYTAVQRMVLQQVPEDEQRERRIRHMKYFAEMATRALEVDDPRRPVETRERLELDRENNRRALETAFEQRSMEDAHVLIRALTHTPSQARLPVQLTELMQRFFVVFPELPYDVEVAMKSRLMFYLHTVERFTECDELLDKLVVDTWRVQELSTRVGLLDGVASMLRMRNRLEAMEEHLQKMEPLVEELNKPGETERFLFEKALLHARKGQIETALEILDSAQVYLKEASYLPRMAVFTTARGQLLSRLERDDEAEKALSEGLSLAKRTGTFVFEQLARNELATVLRRKGQLEEALLLYGENLRKARRLGLAVYAVLDLAGIATLLLLLNDTAGARERAMEALAEVKLVGHEKLLQHVRRTMAFVDFRTGDYKAAQEHLGYTHDSDALKDAVSIASDTALLAAAQYLQGKRREALVTSRQAMRLRDEFGAGSPDRQLLVLSVHARVLRSLRKTEEAESVGEEARELARKHSLNQYGTSLYIDFVRDFVKGNMKTARGGQYHGVCPNCGQGYNGSLKRLQSLRKCMNCGFEPFEIVIERAG
jgi:predicted ATPase